jgi:O-antigen ligase
MWRDPRQSLARCETRVIVDLAVVGGLLLCGLALWWSDDPVVWTAVLATALVAAYCSPPAAFWATCAALPLAYHPANVDSASFSLLEIGIGISGLATLARVVTDRSPLRLADWGPPKDDWWIWIGAGAMVVAGALAIAFQPEREHVREAIRTYRWTILEPLVLLVVARYAIRARGAFGASAAFLIPAVVVALIGTFDWLSTDGGFQVNDIQRATATYPHPNNLALYLERALILGLGIGLVVPRSRRPYWIAGSGIIGVALALTFSRGAIVAVLVGMLALGWMWRSRWSLAAAIAAACAAVIAFVIAAPGRLGGDAGGFLGARAEVWDAAWRMTQDYPVSGIGMDQFLYQHAPRYIVPEAWSERYLSHPHNLLLDGWLSLGVAGLFLICGLGIWVTRQMLESGARGNARSIVRIAALAALLAGLTHGLVDNGYFLADLAAMTWILIALVMTPDGSDTAAPVSRAQKLPLSCP